ncbi:hypothetical protein JB92DRAFT_1651527 [Gautieria morchelliformis]|nr:hypothetical protein JB92DRAFT_1651527 [Gautieria morchelliformis]
MDTKEKSKLKADDKDREKWWSIGRGRKEASVGAGRVMLRKKGRLCCFAVFGSLYCRARAYTYFLLLFISPLPLLPSFCLLSSPPSAPSATPFSHTLTSSLTVPSVSAVPTRTTPAETHVHSYLPYGSQQTHQGTYPAPGQRPRGRSLDSGTVLASSSAAGHLPPPLTGPAVQRQALGLGAAPASGSTPPLSVSVSGDLSDCFSANPRTQSHYAPPSPHLGPVPLLGAPRYAQPQTHAQAQAQTQHRALPTRFQLTLPRPRSGSTPGLLHPDSASIGRSHFNTAVTSPSGSHFTTSGSASASHSARSFTLSGLRPSYIQPMPTPHDASTSASQSARSFTLTGLRPAYIQPVKAASASQTNLLGGDSKDSLAQRALRSVKSIARLGWGGKSAGPAAAGGTSSATAGPAAGAELDNATAVAPGPLTNGTVAGPDKAKRKDKDKRGKSSSSSWEVGALSTSCTSTFNLAGALNPSGTTGGTFGHAQGGVGSGEDTAKSGYVVTAEGGMGGALGIGQGLPSQLQLPGRHPIQLPQGESHPQPYPHGYRAPQDRRDSSGTLLSVTSVATGRSYRSSSGTSTSTSTSTSTGSSGVGAGQVPGSGLPTVSSEGRLSCDDRLSADGRRVSTSSDVLSSRPGSSYTASGEDTGGWVEGVNSEAGVDGDGSKGGDGASPVKDVRKSKMSVRWGGVIIGGGVTLGRTGSKGKGRERDEQQGVEQAERAAKKERKAAKEAARRERERDKENEKRERRERKEKDKKDKEERKENDKKDKKDKEERRTSGTSGVERSMRGVEGRRRTPVTSVFPGLTVFGRGGASGTVSTSAAPAAAQASSSGTTNAFAQAHAHDTRTPAPDVEYTLEAHGADVLEPAHEELYDESHDDDEDFDMDMDEEACVRIAVHASVPAGGSIQPFYVRGREARGAGQEPGQAEEQNAHRRASELAEVHNEAQGATLRESLPPARPRPRAARPMSEQLLGTHRSRPVGIVGSVGLEANDGENAEGESIVARCSFGADSAYRLRRFPSTRVHPARCRGRQLGPRDAHQQARPRGDARLEGEPPEPAPVVRHYGRDDVDARHGRL